MRRFLFVFLLFITLIPSAVAQPEANRSSQALPPDVRLLTPVILIPGTSRSKLAHIKNGRVVWGNFRNFFRLYAHDELALPIDSTDLSQNRDDLVPQSLMEKITVIPVVLERYTHKKFLERMQKQVGYQLGDMDAPKKGDNFFIFVYDWRRSNFENAQRLAQRIEKLKQFYGHPVKFDIIAHCSANYMVRYYALYGDRDILGEANPVPTQEGAQNIRKLILISPPHRGTIAAFQVIHEGFHPVRLPFTRYYSAYEAFSSPAFFEMLPPSGEHPFVDEHGNTLDIDLYDPANWVRYGWSVFSKKEQKHLIHKYKKIFPHSWKKEVEKENQRRLRYLTAVLKKTKAFHEAINEEKKTIAEPVQLYSFVFSAGPTLERVELSSKTGELRFRGGQNEFLRLAPGDLMVTVASMRGRYQERKPQEILLHEQHRRMANSQTLHTQLIQLLLQ